MNQALMILLLALGAHSSSAVGVPELHPVVVAQQDLQSPVVLPVNKGILGSEGVALVDAVMKQSRLYTLLVMEDQSVPLLTRNAKYAVLLNEVHETHQTLEKLLVEMKKNNQFLERQSITQGTHYG